jgi:hypothetical protein
MVPAGAAENGSPQGEGFAGVAKVRLEPEVADGAKSKNG